MPRIFSFPNFYQKKLQDFSNLGLSVTPRPKGRTRGNYFVSLSEPRFPRTSRKNSQAYIDIKTRFKNRYLNLHKDDNPKYSNTRISTENSVEFRLKTGHKPFEKKYSSISKSITYPSIGYPNTISSRNVIAPDVIDMLSLHLI